MRRFLNAAFIAAMSLGVVGGPVLAQGRSLCSPSFMDEFASYLDTPPGAELHDFQFVMAFLNSCLLADFDAQDFRSLAHLWGWETIEGEALDLLPNSPRGETFRKEAWSVSPLNNNDPIFVLSISAADGDIGIDSCKVFGKQYEPAAILRKIIEFYPVTRWEERQGSCVAEFSRDRYGKRVRRTVGIEMPTGAGAKLVNADDIQASSRTLESK
ncbi:hypothetical protein [Aurantimonas sp. A3-2-R12]|uniref:hypothetical protein n=1 Tax=Aurantimonas sp. A3-2-R12 TaxID=3114362 RepID=UPI002E17C577|nr:hypothetical protein [Aurantimonas sp. A3-2-R12]